MICYSCYVPSTRVYTLLLVCLLPSTDVVINFFLNYQHENRYGTLNDAMQLYFLFNIRLPRYASLLRRRYSDAGFNSRSSRLLSAQPLNALTQRSPGAQPPPGEPLRRASF